MSSSVKLIAFLGKKGSGKSTCCSFLEEKGYTTLNFADPLKESCRLLFNLSDRQLFGDMKETYSEELGYTPREILQVFGTEIMKKSLSEYLPNLKTNRNIWIKNIKSRITLLKEKGETKFCIGDLRFEDEAKFVKDMGGKIIKIERTSLKDNSFSSHVSETEMENIKSDMTILNDESLEALRENMNFWIE